MKLSYKAVILTVTTSLMLLGNTLPVLATESSASATVTPKPRSLIQEQFKTTIKALKEADETSKSKMHAARLRKNFGIYELRLNKIAARIQTLIDKRRTAGKDVAKAQAQLDTGKVTLLQAVTDGKKTVEMFNAITLAKWDIKNSEVKAAIAQAILARKEFVQARLQMVQAVKLLRELK